MRKFEEALKKSADATLKRQYIEKKDLRSKKVDPPWFTREIENNIKLRKHYNRQRRNAPNEEEMHVWRACYLEQKNTVMSMVKTAITDHELKITEEIKQNANSKKKWQYINKLRNKNDNANESGEGEDIPTHDIPEMCLGTSVRLH